jgi:hypothetical protein
MFDSVVRQVWALVTINDTVVLMGVKNGPLLRTLYDVKGAFNTGRQLVF